MRKNEARITKIIFANLEWNIYLHTTFTKKFQIFQIIVTDDVFIDIRAMHVKPRFALVARNPARFVIITNINTAALVTFVVLAPVL